MTDPIPSAGETTIIGMPAITIPITTTGDRPLTQEDLDTVLRPCVEEYAEGLGISVD